MISDYRCLIVDLTDWDLSSGWSEPEGGSPIAVRFETNVEPALKVLASHPIAFMVVACRGDEEAVGQLLKSFQANVGSLPEFQAIVCEKPSAKFLTLLMEYGVHHIFSPSNWSADVLTVLAENAELIANEESVESAALRLSRSIKEAKHSEIEAIRAAVADRAEYDFRAAVSKGAADAAIGDYASAAQALKAAVSLNEQYRPARSNLGENLLLSGQIDEAEKVFAELEVNNQDFAERKAQLSAVYIEKGDLEKAREYVKDAQELSPDSSETAVVEVLLLLQEGKVQEALRKLKFVREAGPLLASKLNQLGIKLSSSHKLELAIKIYEKTHSLVEPQYKYKISMNAGLACYRANDFDGALKYLERAKSEFSGEHEKLEKLVRAVTKKKSEKKAS